MRSRTWSARRSHSFQIWNHTEGECWLKHLRSPLLAPKYNQRGSYTRLARRQHRSMPPEVQWVSGVLSRTGPGPEGSCWGKTCVEEHEAALSKLASK